MEKKEIVLEIERLETELAAVKGTECEVYSRIVGYFRPIKQWNSGKQEEYSERETFDVSVPETSARAS
jgi:ribonucleoside-triphosphate reductase